MFGARNIQQYHKVINKSDAPPVLPPERKVMEQVIYGRNFKQFIISLSEEEKSKLIASLIMNDNENIINMLQQSFSNINISSICINHSNYRWLSPVVDKIIIEVLENSRKNSNLIIPRRILQNAMCMIPDMFLNISTKKKICEAISPVISEGISSLAYEEFSKPISGPELNGELTFPKFLKVSNVDMSEFILICRGTFYNKIKDVKEKHDLNNNLDNVLRLYQNLEYDEAINILVRIVNQNKNIFGNDVFSHFNKLYKNLSPIVPEKNYARRFYENRLAQFYLGEGINLNSFNKISSAIIERKVISNEQVPTGVMDVFSDHTKFARRYHELLKESKLFLHRKRSKKRFLSKSD